MITVLRRSIEIDRSLAEVWAYIADMSNYVQWFPGILQMRPADTLPVGVVGKGYDEIARLPDGKEASVQVRVVESMAPFRLAIEASLEPPRPRFDYEMEAISARRTRFTWICRARNTALHIRPFLLLMRVVLGRRLTRALANLKSLLERPADQHMGAWMLRRFGAIDDVMLFHPHLPRPQPGPNEVLIKVAAAGVNPIDALRCGGYGRTLLRLKRAATTPLILGNDVAGIVVAVGTRVQRWRVGERVFGAKAHGSAGTHAPYVAVNADALARTPADTSDVDAASLPYAFLTAWSALVDEAGLSADNARSKRVFVQGGGSSVGLAAIQLLKAWGAHVTCTCGASSRALAESAGADVVLDRAADPYAGLDASFDVALCCADLAEEPKLVGLLKPHAGAVFVSIVHPTLALADRLGLFNGLRAAKREQRRRSSAATREGKAYRWCVMSIKPQGMTALGALLAERRMRAHVAQTFASHEAVAALKTVAHGHTRGKVVIVFDDKDAPAR